jgi:molecular chaperone HtpG
MEAFTQQTIPMTETYNYTADTDNVMRIMIESLYSDKDIFLRELISNASDAITKLKTIGLGLKEQSKQSNVSSYPVFEIKISFSKEHNQIIIQDSGCGITKEDLITKIGSIATSGTKQFIEALQQGRNSSMIGQFGVGFYSAYLVSDAITVITRPYGTNKTYEWKTSNRSNYTIKELDSNYDPEFIRGTKIILDIKDDCKEEYLNEEKLIKIIQTHSSYIEYPIYFYKKQDVKNSQSNSTSNNEQKPEYSWEKINFVPIWNRSKDSITHEQYVDFYLNFGNNKEQHIKDPPIHYKHFSVEGSVDFKALLYIPAKAPFNLFEESNRGNNIKLYTKNVMITADHKNLYPKWMEFIKGVIDTSDITLNVSRQSVQDSPSLRKIYNQLVRKTIELMEEISQDEEKFSQFYQHFSQSLKNGIHEEFSRESKDRTSERSDRMEGNRNGKRMLKLLRFHTSHDRFIGFDDYVNRMRPEQKAIYYIAGDKKEVLETSPFLDRLKQVGYEVLYLTEPIDEYLKAFLTEYKNGEITGIHDEGYQRFKDKNELESEPDTKVFVDVSRDDLLISNQLNEKEKEQTNELCKKLMELYKSIGINFFEVIPNDKFTTVPAIVVSRVHLSAQLEKLLCNNAMSKRKEQYQPMFDRKNLLVSLANPITKHLFQKLCVENLPIDDPEIIDIAKFIHTTALISGGYEINDANNFVRQAIKYMQISVFS